MLGFPTFLGKIDSGEDGGDKNEEEDDGGKRGGDEDEAVKSEVGVESVDGISDIIKAKSGSFGPFLINLFFRFGEKVGIGRIGVELFAEEGCDAKTSLNAEVEVTRIFCDDAGGEVSVGEEGRQSGRMEVDGLDWVDA